MIIPIAEEYLYDTNMSSPDAILTLHSDQTVITLPYEFEEHNISLSIGNIRGEDLNLSADVNDTALLDINATWGGVWITYADYNDHNLTLTLRSKTGVSGEGVIRLLLKDVRDNNATFDIPVTIEERIIVSPEIREINTTTIVEASTMLIQPVLLAGTGDVTTWSLVTAPQGVEINATTGEVKWETPIVGTYTFEINASNSAGWDTEQWSVQVNALQNLTASTDTLNFGAVFTDTNSTR